MRHLVTASMTFDMIENSIVANELYTAQNMKR